MWFGWSEAVVELSAACEWMQCGDEHPEGTPPLHAKKSSLDELGTRRPGVVSFMGKCF